MKRRQGITIPQFKTERISSSVIVDFVTDCWLWNRSLNTHGYGQISINGKFYSAHRASYTHFVDVIPAHLHLDHLCRVRCCVNPNHLEPVTQAENNRRALLAQNPRHETTCKNGHERTEARDKRGYRYCVQCHREDVKKYKKKLREAKKEKGNKIGH